VSSYERLLDLTDGASEAGYYVDGGYLYYAQDPRAQGEGENLARDTHHVTLSL
jgi:hypothetical protein